jgi:hypothetical protein
VNFGTRAPAGAPAPRRARGESGAVVVEFALIAPLLFLLIMGMIDFGNIYSNQISIRQGVREAARVGVVKSFGSSCTLNALDSPAPSADIQDLMCTVKNRIGITPASSIYTKVIFDPSYGLNNGLVVCAQMQAQSLSGMTTPFISGVFLKSKVEMNIEQATASETGGEETAPSGANWNWCTAAGSTP